MTTFVNLLAGPGVGKSTTAAKVFSRMKEKGQHAELVQEYVKSWAWEKRSIVTPDQYYFFGKQSRRESVLAGKVDFVVTDAPSILTSYYTQVYGDPGTAALFRLMQLDLRRMLEKDGHSFVDIWLKRCKPYDPRGRFQSEQEAIDIDNDLLHFLNSMKIKLHVVAGDEMAADRVLHVVNNLTTPSCEIG